MLEERLRFFSDWYRAKKAIALCLLYILRLKQRSQNGVNEASVESTLTVENIRKAEDVVIRAVQFTSFQTEVRSLKSFPSDGALKERPLAKRRPVRSTNWILSSIPTVSYELEAASSKLVFLTRLSFLSSCQEAAM